uniref:receptor-like protein EIX2 n=1 Tax=Erigeron canadensis TaxID=72917 RepID=UPI001CB9B3D2|nr:receptor-like protein EIX2 [Erigeron canadensis]
METIFLVIFILLFMFFQTYAASSNDTMIIASSNITCIQKERQTLLLIRQGITDQSNRLSTWTGLECCEWQGVVCDEKTGQVVELGLSGNGITSTIPVWLSNLTGLMHLYLNNNNFHGRIPDSIGTLSSLSSMDLSYNQLSGPIPSSFGGLSTLKVLSLSYNQLSGSIPKTIGLLTKLERLSLWNNQLSGNIPTSLGHLANLRFLYLRSNRLSGVVSEIHFTKLKNLTWLSLSENSLIRLNVSPYWIPPFQLTSFYASSCNIGPRFPSWFQTQTNLRYLYLRNSSIKDTIPEWFENISSHLWWLDLFDNQICGNLPRIHINNTVLIKLIIAQSKPGLEIFNLGKNSFSGSVPSHLCKLLSIRILDLSNNNLSGFLPKCLGNLIQLLVMDLTNNTIMGYVPNSLGSLSYFQSLHLNNNKFEGNLPVALQNLTSLVTFDLGNNLLTGNIPSWIGKRLSKLRILNLQSNKFMGEIPRELCQINDLQHLNLANNSLTGNIPHCFCYLTGMMRSEFNFTYDNYGYTENIEGYIKGIELKYTKTIKFFVSLDLSSNKINGEIPDVLMNLISLTNLNLSRNLLSGHIPERIGNLKALESLDLSTNKLSGRIPPSLASLNYLSYVNLSFNKLFGPIPVGNQFNTFNDPTMYEGNNGLCGKPLPRNCKGSNTHVGDGKSKDSSHGLSWFYTGMVSGFVIGFMGLIGSLHFIRIWRITYFETIENVCSWLTVLILVTHARLKRKSF